MSRFERSIDVDCPVERLFAFHLDTRHAAAIAPPSQRVVRVDGTFPVVEGDVVNRPSDGHERRITSAVLILPGPDPGE